MMNEEIIKVDRVKKTFRLPHERNSSLKGALVNFWKLDRGYEKQEALKDISFSIKRGEFFGIVGRNGSGKSTLLKLLAGIYTPDSGSIKVDGKITPFIELGVGFNPELTGRENIYLNGALLGFSRRQVRQMYKDIVAFAELERFMDQKLKNYSSGMQVRLAFSIAIRAQTAILLIDEVLAVGDAAFQAKCFEYFQKLKKSDATVVFVSHDRAALERFCDKGILINDGEIVSRGDIREVLKSYSSIVLGELDKQQPDFEKKKRKGEAAGHVTIFDTQAIDSKGVAGRTFNYGDDITVKYGIKFNKAVVNPIMGITIWKKDVEQPIYAANTLMSGNERSGSFKAGDTLELTTRLPRDLNDGEYFVEPAVANESITVFFDQVPKAARFLISGSKNPYSIIASDEPVEVLKKQ